MNKVKLGKLLKIKYGYAFKSDYYVEGGKFALVTLANITESNNFSYDPTKTTYYDANFPQDVVLRPDDLIMPLTEQVVGLFGNSAFVPKINGVTFLLNQRVGKVEVDEAIADKYYIHHLLSTETVRRQLEYRASGTRQRNISRDDVYEVDVFVPPLELQRLIGRLLNSIEERVNLNNRINDNLSMVA